MARGEVRLSEDWIKEFEKIALTKKIHKLAENIGKARMIVHMNTNLERKREAILACIAGFEAILNSLPILEQEEKTIKSWKEKIREYSKIMSYDEEVAKKYGISYIVVRDGMNLVKIPSVSGMDKILDLLDDLMVEINLWTTKKGLRITLPMERKVGKEALLEEEELDLIDLG